MATTAETTTTPGQTAAMKLLGINLPVDYGPGRGAIGGGRRPVSRLETPAQAAVRGGGAVATPGVPGTSAPVNVGSVGGGSMSATGSTSVSGGTPAASLGSGVNTAQTSPVLDEVIGMLRTRLGGDMGAGDAARRMAQEVRDNASGLMTSTARANESRRGVSGSGVSSFNDRNIAGTALRDITKGTAEINAAAEARKDAAILGLGNVGVAQTSAAQQAQRDALQQWAAIQANQRALDQAASSRQDSIIQMLLSA